ncbi:MAG: hypothetical protein K8I03_03005 [Ignavibacteria bacterium]|nr:hypothetical protein [Ignavibacteria bacterium]
MSNKYKIILITAFVLFVCISGNRIFAQDDFREKIEDIKLEKLTKKLDLDESTKTGFIEKYKSFSKSMRQLNQRRAKTYKLMTENIESGNGLDTLVNQLLELEEQINSKREEFVVDMKSILSAKQIAKMIVFERKFNNEIKKLLKQYQKDNKKEQPFKD